MYGNRKIRNAREGRWDKNSVLGFAGENIIIEKKVFVYVTDLRLLNTTIYYICRIVIYIK